MNAVDQNKGGPIPAIPRLPDNLRPKGKLAEASIVDSLVQKVGSDIGCALGECHSLLDTTLAIARLLGPAETRALWIAFQQIQIVNANDWEPGANDEDWRGKDHTFNDALDEAFRRTGVARDRFTPTKWGKSKDGKSFPAEWQSPGGGEVSVDVAHEKDGPDAPHVGWQTPGKRGSGGGKRGHILVDDVPYHR